MIKQLFVQSSVRILKNWIPVKRIIKNMNSKNLLLIAVLVAAVASTDFGFDLQNCRVDSFDAWDEITFPCKGGSNDYDYSFEKLPKNWFGSRGKVYAPKGEIDTTNNFAIRVSVLDRSSKKSLKKCIVFNFKNRSFKNVFDAEYDFDIDNKYNVDDYIYRREKGDISYTQTKTEVNIRPTYPTYVFPTEKEIEDVIIKGDIAWIKRIIDDAINSGLKCKDIATFLSRVLTLIQSHISIFRNDAEGIRQDIYRLKEELTFITAQLKDLEGSTINIELLRKKIADFKIELDLSLQQKSGFQAKITYNEEQINKNQKEIYSISETVIRDAQYGVDSETEKINKISQEITGLELQIQLLKKSQQTSINNRDLYVRKITEAKEKINILVNNNQRLQSLIFDLREEFTAIEVKIASINVKIEELNRQIANIGYGKDAEIREIKLRISSLESQINAETNEARKLELIYAALEGSLTEFQNTINKHYYSCYKVIDDKDDDVSAAPSDAFINYLKEVFGSAPNSNIRARFGGDIINIKHSTIFSPEWVRVYGIPFSAGYGNNMDIMETDFKCEDVANLEVFSGRISSITRNVINVKDAKGDAYTVHLGGCTRLETATKADLPAVGDEVYWKGKRRNNNAKDFNGYHFTCY